MGLRARAVLLSLSLALVPLAHAQGGNHRLPQTNGTSTSRMEAPETNSELESYTHSPMVQSIAHYLGLSTDQASRYFEDFNSGVLILTVLFFLLKYVPGKLRAKRETIDRELADARAASAEAQQRMSRVEAQVAALGGEIEALRRQAAEGAQGEYARMQAAMEEERQRIVHSAETDIAALQANAERGLKRYAAELAVERAERRVHLSPDEDRAVVDEFLHDLAGQLQKQGQN